MFKGNRKYMFVLGLCFTALIILQLISPKPINWRPSYQQKETIPYGTSALSSILPGLFPGQTISTSNTPAFNTFGDGAQQHGNYLVINQTFEPDKLDSRELLKFISEGNNAFIAANYFGGPFADTLKLKTDGLLQLGSQVSDDSALQQVFHPTGKVELEFLNPTLSNKKYLYTKEIENSYFSSFDSAKVCLLGKNSGGGINFIRIAWGKGNLYLSTVPEAFTNYQLVHPANCGYVYTALSYLPNQPIIWDEYYKVGNNTQDSPLRVLFNNAALRTAYDVLLISLVIFLLLGIKRQQRIIPVIEPLKNTSLQFVEVVGTLYFQQGNHKNIAEKKIHFFLDFIRTNFQVRTAIFDTAFLERISALSGIEQEKVKELFYYIAEIQTKTTLSQQELLMLNQQIENFHRENKR